MAAPAGTNVNRWNQVVTRIVDATSVPTAEVDVWLNGVYANTPGVEASRRDLRNPCVAWLEVNMPNAFTLGQALRDYVD